MQNSSPSSPAEPPQYVIWYDDERCVGPVDPLEVTYLDEVIEPALEPLSDADYVARYGPILETAARASYVLRGAAVYWCVEWKPGLVVVRFEGDTMRACELVSPVPEFGGRVATQAELDAWDEDARNHQIRLVFDAWDAQFDADDFAWGGFAPAPADVLARFEAAVAHANALIPHEEDELDDDFEDLFDDDDDDERP